MEGVLQEKIWKMMEWGQDPSYHIMYYFLYHFYFIIFLKILFFI